MKRSWLTVIVIIVLGGIALVIVGHKLGARSVRTSSQGNRNAATPSPATKSNAPDVVRQVIKPAPAVPAAEPADLAGKEDEVDLSGIITVVDESGREHVQESGLLGVALWTHELSKSLPDIPVTGGRFHVRVPRTTQLRVQKLVLGNRQALLEGDDLLSVPVIGSVQLNARWPRPLLLHVVDAATGAELSNVTLVTSTDRKRANLEHPGDESVQLVLAHNVSSPIALPCARTIVGSDSGPAIEAQIPSTTAWHQIIHAWSPQHAWARIELNYKTGGDVRLPLQGQSAELEITLHDSVGKLAIETSPVVLRLRSQHIELDADKTSEVESSSLGDTDEESSAHEALKSDEILEELTNDSREQPQVEVTAQQNGPTVITGLIPGYYTIAAEIGDWFNNPLVLAEQSVELLPGKRTMLDLQLQAFTSNEQRVPLSGTLLIPPAWGDVDMRLQIASHDRPDLKDEHVALDSSDMQLCDPATGLYRWNAGSVFPGRYKAAISAFAWEGMITVGNYGNTSVAIVIGSPADVTLKFIDDVLGSDIVVDKLTWSSDRSVFESTRSASVAPSQGSTSFHFRAPSGKTHVSWTTQYQLHEKWLSLNPGVNAIVIPVSQSTGVIIRLVEGPSTVSWPDSGSRYVDVDRIDGQQLRRIGFSRSSDFVAVTLEPAVYRLTIKSIPGFRSILPFEIEIKHGEMLERVIKLQREN